MLNLKLINFKLTVFIVISFSSYSETSKNQLILMQPLQLCMTNAKSLFLKFFKDLYFRSSLYLFVK